MSKVNAYEKITTNAAVLATIEDQEWRAITLDYCGSVLAKKSRMRIHLLDLNVDVIVKTEALKPVFVPDYSQSTRYAFNCVRRRGDGNLKAPISEVKTNLCIHV